MSAKPKSRLLFVVTVLLYISFGLLTSVIGVIIDRFENDYNVSLSIAALLPFAFYVAYGLTSVPFGLAMDKFGAKRILLLGTLLMALGSFLCFISSNYLVVILVIFLVGVGVTAIQVAGNPFIRELDKPDNYTANLTIIIGIGSLGYAFSPLLVPIMQANGFSWKTVYLLFGFFNTVLLIVLAMASFPRVKLNEEEKINYSSIGLLLKHPVIITYSLGIFLYVGAEVGVSSYIIIYMNRIHGVINSQSFWAEGTFMNAIFPSKTALVVALFWLLQAMGRLIISVMMRYFSEKKIFIFHSLGTVLALLVAITGNANTALVAFALVGYFTCASFTSIFSAAINSFGEYHGTISGILGTAIVGGAFLGWLVGFTGQHAGMKWGMAVNVVAFLYVTVLALWGKGKLDIGRIREANSNAEADIRNY
ncbi:MAG TPA: MFS transporter [Bacteroidales bacterium]|jgi:fucose permease|nr:MFS transporter [Bacteroidales bacterium]HNR40833.1 MFS transporter [Bacteroidales bacterium]HQG76427.1 MFS transporter [Bacteroidales bacterium]